MVPFHFATRVHTQLGITFWLITCKTGMKAKYYCVWQTWSKDCLLFAITRLLIKNNHSPYEKKKSQLIT